ncbi:hypothetical protein GDO81_001971 [Engystomops pustulosus]|uniref:Secreted protein n=1 Tax=Engystomops pustulosus TaxID=76066 RepID=A0AAV7DGH4_ENGPU|nr:hypothetical protein GDO81_001971 [Engystomops pustulosus]
MSFLAFYFLEAFSFFFLISLHSAYLSVSFRPVAHAEFSPVITDWIWEILLVHRGSFSNHACSWATSPLDPGLVRM